VKKDIIYSMRMTRRVREALKEAARRDRRTVASLLDKIITDYLESEGFSLHDDEISRERRRFPRKKITLPGTAYMRTSEGATALPGVILDISLGGVLVTYPKGSGVKLESIGELPNFELHFALPDTGDRVVFGCDARRINDTGNEIQIGATFAHCKEQSAEKLQGYLM